MTVTAAERQASAVKLRAEGYSLRAIATRLNVSHEQVRKDLSSAGELSTPERITGLDGRNRPSTVNRDDHTGDTRLSTRRHWKPPAGTRCAKCGTAPPGPGGILCPDCKAAIRERVGV